MSIFDLIAGNKSFENGTSLNRSQEDLLVAEALISIASHDIPTWRVLYSFNERHKRGESTQNTIKRDVRVMGIALFLLIVVSNPYASHIVDGIRKGLGW